MSHFAIVLVELYRELQAAGCGIEFVDCMSNAILISMITFVDDIALITSSPEQLQIALNIISSWARRLRMRLNLGEEKSAVMMWGKSRISHRDLAFKFFLGHHRMPIVRLYKYLGIRIGRSGGWQHQNTQNMLFGARSP